MVGARSVHPVVMGPWAEGVSGVCAPGSPEVKEPVDGGQEGQEEDEAHVAVEAVASIVALILTLLQVVRTLDEAASDGVFVLFVVRLLHAHFHLDFVDALLELFLAGIPVDRLVLELAWFAHVVERKHSHDRSCCDRLLKYLVKEGAIAGVGSLYAAELVAAFRGGVGFD